VVLRGRGDVDEESRVGKGKGSWYGTGFLV